MVSIASILIAVPALGTVLQWPVCSRDCGLLLLTAAASLPKALRDYYIERWCGYAKSSPAVDAVQNPFVFPSLMALSIASAIAMEMPSARKAAMRACTASTPCAMVS